MVRALCQRILHTRVRDHVLQDMGVAACGNLVPVPLEIRGRVSHLDENPFSQWCAWKQPRYPSADEWIRKLWYIYTTEYYSAIKKNTFESVLKRWMKLEPIIQSEVSQKEKHQYSILTHIYGI